SRCTDSLAEPSKPLSSEKISNARRTDLVERGVDVAPAAPKRVHRVLQGAVDAREDGSIAGDQQWRNWTKPFLNEPPGAEAPDLVDQGARPAATRSDERARRTALTRVDARQHTRFP